MLADPLRLRQVLVNLLENAIKYSPETGSVRLGIESLDGSVRFLVSDEGPGIPEPDRRRIFDKFVRLDPPRRNVQGSGLGLAIVHDFVRRMGGTIAVFSAPGGGAAFAVELPAAGA